jgi:hypothetical protein
MKVLGIAAVPLIVAASAPSAPALAATPKPKLGGTCTKAQVGKQVAQLVCLKSGVRYRWRQAAAPAASSSVATPAANSATLLPIGADAWTIAFGGLARVEANNPGKLSFEPDELNSDGACNIAALLRPFAGCGGTVEIAGRPLRWSVLGSQASEWMLDSARRPARSTVGAEQSLFSPTQYGPDGAGFYWFTQHGKLIKYEGTIRYFNVRLTTLDKSAIAATDETEDTLFRVATYVEKRLAAAGR